MPPDPSLAPLLEPLRLGPITLKNRVLFAALTRSRSVPTNVPNALNLEYYTQRTGAGLIVTEGILVSPQGTEWPHAPGIWSKEQISAWRKITDVVHADGSFIYAQLWHAGRASHPDMPEQKASGVPVYAPSAIAAKGGKFRQLPGQPGYATPTAVEDPETLAALFKQAAINAKEAGFDGVEIHGANGYLVHEFLDSTSNVRTDKWGGSIENRSRFPLEVLKALTDVWGPDRVAIKLSPAGGYNDMGMPLQETTDTFRYFITEALKLKLSYISLVRHLPLFDPTGRGTAHDVTTTYGDLFAGSSTLYLANGGFTPAEAAAFVKDGKSPGVFFGVLWIAHPDLAQRIRDGKAVDAQIDFATLYGSGGTEEEERKGYADYPAAG